MQGAPASANSGVVLTDTKETVSLDGQGEPPALVLAQADATLGSRMG